ncbi:hypothetical protein Nmel_017836 [Mimus melanotis]
MTTDSTAHNVADKCASSRGATHRRSQGDRLLPLAAPVVFRHQEAPRARPWRIRPGRCSVPPLLRSRRPQAHPRLLPAMGRRLGEKRQPQREQEKARWGRLAVAASSRRRWRTGR